MVRRRVGVQQDVSSEKPPLPFPFKPRVDPRRVSRAPAPRGRLLAEQTLKEGREGGGGGGASISLFCGGGGRGGGYDYISYVIVYGV